MIKQKRFRQVNLACKGGSEGIGTPFICVYFVV